MKLAEECGIFGGIANIDIAPIIRSGLIQLQHRGEDGTGLCCFDKNIHLLKGAGRADKFFSENSISSLVGKIGIGHVRYSTSHDLSENSIQPFVANIGLNNVAMAHNGHINAIARYKNFNIQLESNSDSEILLKFTQNAILEQSLEFSFENCARVLYQNFSNSAWCLVFASAERVFAFRDADGFRPLVLCRAKEGIFVASEDCAFKGLDVLELSEIKPGQGVEITNSGYKIQDFVLKEKVKQCVFEHIYFAQSESNIFGANVAQSRLELGRICAQENPVDADIVVPVLNSGYYSALGYSQYSGIPMHTAIDADSEAGRSFIQPEQSLREQKVAQKLKIRPDQVKNKKIVVVDDSIVRGTTSLQVVNMLKQAGAAEVHFRLSSPKIVNTCSWGVDIPTREELLACKFGTDQEICEFIGADSIGFVSNEGLNKVFAQNSFCTNCLEPDKGLSLKHNSELMGASK